MRTRSALGLTAVLIFPLSVVIGACESTSAPMRSTMTVGDLGTQAHRDRVMTSRFCGECHPAIYAEHAENTHGRAFTDPEPRLATGRFAQGDCIRCHTPRPIFETGIGQNPIRRYHNLEEGNTCMTCHQRSGYDYSRFEGGAECKTAFDPRVGTVEACASCHRNHGTPYQWELAPNGKQAGKKCIDCHMQRVRRPVAVGEQPRRVRSHVFPGSKNDAHVRKAYKYETRIDGNEVVAKISNIGAGHNFPTELKQRAVVSVVVVRDVEGNEVSRSRMVFRDPYKRPYGLMLPVNTQIPSGQWREHRVPLKVASGTVDCELHFKLYFPIEDYHPDLSRRLELHRLVFDGITPSDKEVESAPDVKVTTPEGIKPEIASLPQLVDFAHPKIGKVEIDVPQGNDPDSIKKLIQLFQFPVPEGNRRAQKRLVEIGKPAIPALIEALGSWDNKTFKQATAVLKRIGDDAAPAVVDALSSDQLYIRHHATKIIADMGWVDDEGRVKTHLLAGLSAEHAIDRSDAARAVGRLGITEATPGLRGLLDDVDPDVVRDAAHSLAQLGDKSAVPAIEKAMEAASFVETQSDLAVALAMLGSPDGIPVLLAGLDHDDDLIRENMFESLFAVTGLYKGYDPNAPRAERLAAISRLQAFWAKEGGPSWLREPPFPDEQIHNQAWELVTKLGSNDDEPFAELASMREDAVSALLLGLKFPPGFAARRARICELLRRIGSRDAAPFLAATLRDPVIAVAAWAASALETCGDEDTIPALRRYHDRLLTLINNRQLPANITAPDQLLAQVARTRLVVGDEMARQDLINLLMSNDRGARGIAIAALESKYGDTRGYDPDADPAARRAAAASWQR